MTEPQMPDPQMPEPPAGGTPTPGEARREGLKKSKWVAAGVAVGAAAFLTGVIAGVNGADSDSSDSQQISSAVPGGFEQAPTGGYDDRRYHDDRDESDDDDRYESDDDDYGSARPFDPRSGGSTYDPRAGGASSGSTTQQAPSAGPQSRSGGS